MKSVPVATTELVELAATGEDEESNLDIAENRELSSLLHQPAPPLRESHLTTTLVLDSLQHHLPPPHFSSPNSLTVPLALYPL